MEKDGVINGRQKYIKEIEGKAFMSCVTPAYLYGLETVAQTETTTEAAGLKDQLGQEDCGCELGG